MYQTRPEPSFNAGRDGIQCHFKRRLQLEMSIQPPMFFTRDGNDYGRIGSLGMGDVGGAHSIHDLCFIVDLGISIRIRIRIRISINIGINDSGHGSGMIVSKVRMNIRRR